MAEASATHLPLFSPVGAGRAAYFRGAPIAQAELEDAARRVASQLPPAQYVVNLCSNRYLFLCAWLAACLRDQVTLLPPAQSLGILQELARTYPELQRVDDARVLQWLQQPSRPSLEDAALPAERIVAIAFTSGSTGAPQAHPKQWRTLRRNAQLAAAEVLGDAGSHIVATVPPQHAYGLETSVLTAISAGCVIFDGRPFFPHDVKAALESIPEPRTLVTTPAHLQALFAARTQLPSVSRVVSATAPLAIDLAQEIERAWRTAVFEIYGCTEAGVVAWRRSSESSVWRTFDGGRVHADAAGARYSAPQLPQAIELQDVIEPLSETQFHLHDRLGDMIKVAGKRASLAGLTAQLRRIVGVADAIVFAPTADARPAALVVAPGKSSAEIARELSTRIDPVFVPRPLLCVPRLPRDALGKLPHDALLRALATHGAQR